VGMDNSVILIEIQTPQLFVFNEPFVWKRDFMITTPSPFTSQRKTSVDWRSGDPSLVLAFIAPSIRLNQIHLRGRTPEGSSATRSDGLSVVLPEKNRVDMYQSTRTYLCLGVLPFPAFIVVSPAVS
jgi:hypothetical protein